MTCTPVSTAVQKLHHLTNPTHYIIHLVVILMILVLDTNLCVYPTISLNLTAVSTSVEKLFKRYMEKKAFYIIENIVALKLA